MVLPEGLMCPFNSQNTLFDQKALWGTLIPITTSFRVCDIWRGYWVQVSALALCFLSSQLHTRWRSGARCPVQCLDSICFAEPLFKSPQCIIKRMQLDSDIALRWWQRLLAVVVPASLYTIS